MPTMLSLRRTIRVLAVRFLASLPLFGMAGGGCFCLPQPFEPGAVFLRERHPKSHADFDGRYPLDFQVGDRFELLQDMYLFEGGVDSTWDLRRDAWDQASRPVIRVVRTGETIEVSALKLSPYQRTLFVYLKLGSGEDWVVYNLFDWPDKGHYDRKLFKKL